MKILSGKPSGNEPAIVVGKTYDLVLWLLPKAEKFPHSYRFSLGDRVVSYGLDLLLILVAAAYTVDKGTLLEQASQKVNGLRYLLRLAKDLRLLSMDGYGFALERLDEIGRMVGGWRRATAVKRL
ncbi:MAG TPA: diversity-generating retroelement protein Avd [Terriglobia bacterium]|nr:diversity-generating retroelement protein Avd [Terriglobia bacterium]